MRTTHSSSLTRGFTLIEIAVVLVIVGLIAAGVFVGKRLIAAAEARALLTRLDQTDAALATFRTKYKYLPGDIPGRLATGYGLPAKGTSGNGDGIIGSTTETTFYLTQAWEDEIAYVFPQLSTENLIPGGPYSEDFASGNALMKTFGSDNKIMVVGSPTLTDLSGFLPNFAKFPVKNYYVVANIMASRTNSNNKGFFPSVNAETGFALDTKRDDGMPLTGTVRTGGIHYTSAATAGTGIPVPIMQSPPAFVVIPSFPLHMSAVLSNSKAIFGIDPLVVRKQWCISSPLSTEANYLVNKEDSICTMIVGISGD